MEENKFELTLEQLKQTAETLKERIAYGLSRDDSKEEIKNEIACLPTFIQPKGKSVEGTALVLDLGGTNYRVAKVEISGEKTTILPENGWKTNLEKMKDPGFSKENLLDAMSELIEQTKREEEMPIGYCFSYPAESLSDGDARLLRWTKGVDIPGMVGEGVGKPLVEYLNQKTTPGFTGIKVINDTVASLFAGMTKTGYDAYIGLIVGTGTNMAAMMPAKKISKIAGMEDVDFDADIPVNLESGNFNPPFLTTVDEHVDKESISYGCQHFEKAVSGMYLGEILKVAHPWDRFFDNFNAKSLTDMMNFPDMYKEKFVVMAKQIYVRSASLVAASLAGLILQLSEMYDKPLNSILITADGSLYWSKYHYGKDYNVLVMDYLKQLLKELGLLNIKVEVNSTANVNLIGSAIAALS